MLKSAQERMVGFNKQHSYESYTPLFLFKHLTTKVFLMDDMPGHFMMRNTV